MLDTNLTAAYRVCKRAAGKMLRARSGRIVLVSSVVALTGSAGQTNYAAAKAGLIGFGRSLARELGSRGITVNVVLPGFVQTDMTAVLPDERRSRPSRRRWRCSGWPPRTRWPGWSRSSPRTPPRTSPGR